MFTPVAPPTERSAIVPVLQRDAHSKIDAL